MIFIYCRVSTTEQATDDRASIPEQVRRCRAVAGVRSKDISNYMVTECIDRGVSGSIPLEKRPAGKKMIGQADVGDVIVASKMDRIFRSASDALNTIEYLKKRSVELILCDISFDPIDSSPVAKLFFTIMSGVAQFERERIHERVIEGKINKKARGGHIGGVAPFGYRKVGSGKSAELVPDEKEILHIEQVKALAAETRCKQKIINRLTEQGMLGRNGQPYNIMAIKRMLRGRTELRLQG